MKNILLVDDDSFITAVYRTKFQNEGYVVEIAADAEQAFASIGGTLPDLVILDLQMPGLSGVDVLRRLRAEPKTRALPVVVFTNAFVGGLVDQAWKAGATQVLNKGNCSPNELMDAVRRLLALRPSARSMASSSKRTAIPGPPALPQGDDVVANLRERFKVRAGAVLAGLDAQLQSFLRSRDEQVLCTSLDSMTRVIHTLTGSASIAGFPNVAQMSAALEALFGELREQPVGITASTVRTVVRGIQTLRVLCGNGEAQVRSMPRQVLVVDDDLISCLAVCAALEKVQVCSVHLTDPQLALRVLAENRFDMVFLDVEMPGMSGLSLCMKMRTMPKHQKTPVVFVTGLADLDSVVRSSLLGNEEVIAKPFPPIELSVKALTYLLHVEEAKASAA